MKIKTLIAIFICLPMVFGCQQLLVEEPTTTQDQQSAEYVVDADGSLYNINCLRANAATIVKNGRGAATSCVMGNAKEASPDAQGRGFYYYYYYYDNWYHYPPSYYDYSYYNNNNNYNYNYDFCGYIFGNQYNNYNCYDNFFTWDTYDYSCYNQDCSYCMYRPNPSKCQNRCWYNQGWHW